MWSQLHAFYCHRASLSVSTVCTGCAASELLASQLSPGVLTVASLSEQLRTSNGTTFSGSRHVEPAQLQGASAARDMKRRSSTGLHNVAALCVLSCPQVACVYTLLHCIHWTRDSFLPPSCHMFVSVGN